MQLLQPHAKHHTPTNRAFLELFDAIGMSRAEISRRTGICERRVRYLHAGYRDVGGKRLPVVMSFAEQFLLAALAYKAAD